MTKDYAKRRPTTTRKKKPKHQSSASQLILWLISLLIFVLFTMALVYLGKYQHGWRHYSRTSHQLPVNNKTISKQEAAEVPTGPKFDFYTILPQKKALNSLVTYELEIMTTKEFAVADQTKAELLLLGIEVNIIPVMINNAPQYRVTIGPYSTKENAINDQVRLRKNKIRTILRAVK